MAIPDPAEVGKVIRAAAEVFAAFIAVSSFAGTRRGETSALRVSDANFLRKELHVVRQVQWTDDGRMEIRPPKYGSERTIYIPDGLGGSWPSTCGCTRRVMTRTGTCSREAGTAPCQCMRRPRRGPGAPPVPRRRSHTGCTTAATSSPPG